MRSIIRSFIVAAAFLATQAPVWAQRGRMPTLSNQAVIFPRTFYYYGLPPGGNFAHATLGNFTIGSNMFMPSLQGNSLLIGRGYFLPQNGTFVSTPLGNFALITRDSFNPKTKTFTPSPTGNFLVATRGDLVSSMTKTPVDSVVPVLPSVASAATMNPYAMSAMVNPYAMGAASSPYSSMMNPYSSSYGMSYGSGYSNNAAPTVNVQPTSAPTVSTQAIALGAYGIPTKGGHVEWPLAFRLLPPDKKRELTDTLESQLLALAGQGAGTMLNPAFFQGLKQNVTRLSAWLTEHQSDMAEATYRDGRDFLNNIKATVQALSQ
jgi:hypothetical protein